MNPTPLEFKPVIDAFHDKKIVVFPTDTVFGIGALFGNHELLSRLKQAKRRPENKALPVMVSSIEMAGTIMEIDNNTQKVMEALLPGPLTLIVQAKSEIDRKLLNGLDTIAVRIPDHPVLLELIEGINQPIFATSANLSGFPEAKTLQDLGDMDLDYDLAVLGNCHFAKASTIADVRDGTVHILREGPISLEQLEAVLTEPENRWIQTDF